MTIERWREYIQVYWRDEEFRIKYPQFAYKNERVVLYFELNGRREFGR